MRITGLIFTLFGGIIHANIAAKLTIDWRYWAMAGALFMVFYGGVMIGIAAGTRRIDDEDEIDEW